MAYGNMAGLVIVDVVQNLCLLNMGTADLYGAAGNIFVYMYILGQYKA